jgi:AmmeMemoRadiSam system protein B
MGMIRQPAVAGTFYPAEADQLQSAVDGFLQAARTDQPAPRAMIVPHAGYIYSGPVAASGYARLLNPETPVRRVLLLGPAHRLPFRGIAATSAASFSTPLGDIAIDRAAIDRVAGLSQVCVMDEAHRLEHSLEVQLPFLQRTLGDFLLVPLVVGDATPEEISEILEILWTDPETLVVVSSDLSHYHNYDTARRLDSETSRNIESLDYRAIKYDHACGRNPVNGLLLYAARHGLNATTLDLRNSGDTAGPRDQVVGYGTYVFT